MIILIFLLLLLVVMSSPLTQVGSAHRTVLMNEQATSNLLVATAAPLTKTAPNQKGMPQRRVALGMWGGEHIRMTVSTKGATIEYDCALGSVVGRLMLDAKGRFTASGTLTTEGPGPVRLGAPQSSRPVRYEGKVTGHEMSLIVTLTNQSENVGSFILRRGSEGRLRKCR